MMSKTVVKDYRDLVWNFSSNSSGGQYLKSEKIINGKKYYFKISDFRYGCQSGNPRPVSWLPAFAAEYRARG